MHPNFLSAGLSISLASMPSLAQSAREYPEPCRPFSIGGTVPSTALVPQGSELWMVVFPGAGGVRNDAYSVSIAKEGPSSCFATYIKIDNLYPQDHSYKESARIRVELPASTVRQIEKLWESTLRMTRYQDPKPKGGVIRGLLHADQCYFGFEYRFYGQVSFLATGPALQIQKVGYELVRYVQAHPSERSKILGKMESLLEGPTHKAPHSN